LVKVADFGLARSIEFQTKETSRHPVLTDYVATRWYRAPEILLGSTDYTKGVDMWSIGCILGELLGGKPMFPGTSTMNQLDRIIEVTGRPDKDDIEAINSPFAATMLESLPETDPRSLSSMFPNTDEDALDLLSKLLQFNPNKRITADESLEHPYVAQFHNPEEEITCKKVIQIPINDNKKLSVATYREELYNNVIKATQQLKKENIKIKKSSSKSKKPSSSTSKKEGGASSTSSKKKEGDATSKKHRKRTNSKKDITKSGSGSGSEKKKSNPKKSSSKTKEKSAGNEE